MQTNVKIDQLESTTPLKVGQYILSDRICNNQPISFAANNIGFNYKNYATNKYNIDKESKLFGLDRYLNKYPTFVNEDTSNFNIQLSHNKTDSDVINIGINSRTSKSCQDYSQYDIFTVLPNNLQNPNHIIFNEHKRGGINSRQI